MQAHCSHEEYTGGNMPDRYRSNFKKPQNNRYKNILLSYNFKRFNIIIYVI